MRGERKYRYWAVIGVLGLFAAFVLVRYAYLALTPTKDSAPASAESERGRISDREGRVLAMDSPLYDIAVWRPETDRQAFPRDAAKLAAITGMSETEIMDRWSKGSSDFFYLAKRAQPQAAKAIQDARDAGDFAGVIADKVEGRLYPEKRLASHLVGFVGDGNSGLAGIEMRCDDELLGSGRSLTLTIDADIQFSLERIAREAMTSTGAQAVMLLAAEAKTGEILAYVAMPDFDPNDYSSSPPESWYDWPSVFHYEPGSVFKVFSMASVLDLGGATLDTTFTCDGAYHKTAPSGEKITIKCLGAHGVVDIQKILEFSCNAGAAYASDTVGALDFYDKLRGFGFGSRTGLVVPSETPGLLRSPESWSLRSKPTIAIGQEVFVSAVQMMAAATAISNGGVLLKPSIVKRALERDGSVAYANDAQPVRRVVSEATAAAILSAMETVSSAGGTGARAKVPDIRMAVKTGTAQMIDPATQRYSEKDYVASTLAIFPADDPKAIVYLAIVKPSLGPSYFGGRIAAPLVREAADAILNLSGMPRGAMPTVAHPGTVVLPPVEPISLGDTMPDLTGVPKRLLMPLLARKDIKVRMAGEGYVVSQSPAPGATLGQDAEIDLELK